MFGKDTIGDKVKKVFAERIKAAEVEYADCKAKNRSDCDAKINTAEVERDIKDVEASDKIVSKVLGG